MDKTIESYLDRLDKETYTKEEVAKLNKAEAEFTQRNLSKDIVSKADYDALNEKYEASNKSLAVFEDEKFEDRLSTSFNKFNGDSDRTNDLVKLTGINKDMTDEEIDTTITSLKENAKYEFLFKQGDSGAVKTVSQDNPLVPTQIKELKSSVSLVGGGLDNLLNNIKK